MYVSVLCLCVYPEIFNMVSFACEHIYVIFVNCIISWAELTFKTGHFVLCRCVSDVMSALFPLSICYSFLYKLCLDSSK